ncbi:MAG: VOC family protein [Thermodesulfobacteriota bacterium]
MRFNGLNHIGVAVRDIEKAKDFLKKNFESKLIYEGVSEKQGIHFALVSWGELKLELMAPIKGEGLIAEFINQRGEGIHHLSFQVEDLQSIASFFQEKGFKTIKQPSEIPGIHAMFIHPKSFFGILVEVFQGIEESYV